MAWSDLITALDAATYSADMPGTYEATWGSGESAGSALVHLWPAASPEGSPAASIGRDYLLTAPLGSLAGVVIGTTLSVSGDSYRVMAGPYDDGLGHATLYLDAT